MCILKANLDLDTLIPIIAEIIEEQKTILSSNHLINNEDGIYAETQKIAHLKCLLITLRRCRRHTHS